MGTRLLPDNHAENLGDIALRLILIGRRLLFYPRNLCGGGRLHHGLFDALGVLPDAHDDASTSSSSVLAAGWMQFAHSLTSKG